MKALYFISGVLGARYIDSRGLAAEGNARVQLKRVPKYESIGETAHLEQINLDDFSYVAEFEVGNPPQKLRGLFDTGSTNMWILNESVKIFYKDREVPKKRSYNDKISSTAQKTNHSASIKFGSGSLSGTFFTDDLNFGGINLKQQMFGNVLEQTSIFTGNNFEAIIGLAYPVLAEQGVTPVFDSMMSQL